MIYTNIRVPRSYRAAVPSDVKSSPQDPTVSGEACNYTALFLFSWGNGGYAESTRKALKDQPNAILYDVKADSKLKSILGVYSEFCTIVTGKIAQP